MYAPRVARSQLPHEVQKPTWQAKANGRIAWELKVKHQPPAVHEFGGCLMSSAWLTLPPAQAKSKESLQARGWVADKTVAQKREALYVTWMVNGHKSNRKPRAPQLGQRKGVYYH